MLMLSKSMSHWYCTSWVGEWVQAGHPLMHIQLNLAFFHFQDYNNMHVAVHIQFVLLPTTTWAPFQKAAYAVEHNLVIFPFPKHLQACYD
jgi:hypothetical protein